MRFADSHRSMARGLPEDPEVAVRRPSVERGCHIEEVARIVTWCLWCGITWVPLEDQKAGWVSHLILGR